MRFSLLIKALAWTAFAWKAARPSHVACFTDDLTDRSFGVNESVAVCAALALSYHRSQFPAAAAARRWLTPSCPQASLHNN